MKTFQQIRFSVKKDAVDEVKTLLHEYARYVADYAKEHDELWTWQTYQSTDSAIDFVSVISHQDADAETRHTEADGTKTFAKNLYAHVADRDQAAYRLIASSVA